MAHALLSLVRSDFEHPLDALLDQRLPLLGAERARRRSGAPPASALPTSTEITTSSTMMGMFVPQALSTVKVLVGQLQRSRRPPRCCWR
jgi:hypothetical protein